MLLQGVMCHKLEQQLLLVKDRVDSITSSMMSFEGEQYVVKVEGPVSQFMAGLEDMVTTLRKSLLFLLLKVNIEPQGTQ